jgi:transposase
MARPYSSDLRARVVEAVDEGATRYEAAERIGISVASAVRWHQAWRNEGTIEAKPCGGSRSPLEEYAAEIVELIEAQRDWTLDEFVAAMHKRRIREVARRCFVFWCATASHLKKSHTPASRNGRTWRAPAGAGYASKGCLIRLILCGQDGGYAAPWRLFPHCEGPMLLCGIF